MMAAERQVTNAGKTNKGGYDYEFVEVPDKSLECPICLLTLRAPQVISCCGHYFCSPCIERVQRDKKPCPLCNKNSFQVMLHKGVEREVNLLDICCPQKKLGCQWMGKLGYLEGHQTACGFVEVECGEGCGERFLRRSIPEHEAGCMKRPLQMQIRSIAQKLDAVLADNQSLKEDNHALKEENQTLKEEVARMRTANADMKIEMQRFCEQLRALTGKSEASRGESEAMKKQVAQLESNVSKLNPVPPLTYLVLNIGHLKREDLTWMSPPFYSHVGGYKMRLYIYPNAIGLEPSKVKGVTSLYVGLVVGEYDDELQWPFGGSVTVQVLNMRSKEWELEKTITFPGGQETPSTQKPTAKNLNHPYGIHSYIMHAKLDRYTGDADRLRIRVADVKLNL